MNDLCFLDLETTGFDPEKDSIIEISFVRYLDGEKISEMDQVIIPNKSALSPIVSQITGIEQDEIDREGKVFETLRPLVQEKIGDSIIVGHNIDFDINFLKANGLKLDNNPRIDTHELSRILLINEESYALEVLSQKYGFSHENAHRAMSDVLASKDLLEFLIPKTQNLSEDYIKTISPTLERSNWGAKGYFLNTTQNSATQQPNNRSTDQDNNYSVTQLPSYPIRELPQSGTPSLLRIQKAQEGAHTLSQITRDHEQQKFVITTSKKSFFPGLKTLSPPVDILYPRRLQTFIEGRDLDDKIITFYLKLSLRSHQGLIQREQCDLFFGERDFWKEVSHDEAQNPEYQSYLKGQMQERVLLASHQDFLAVFQTNPALFEDRTLLVDEGEAFVQSALMASNKAYDLAPFLESPDEDLATKTHFFITHFCKQILEKTLEHQINPFPLKLRIPDSKYEKLAEVARNISDDPAIQDFARVLETPQDYDLRWAYYTPDNGYLTLNTWNKSDWEALLKHLAQIPTLMTHRHNLEGQPLHFFQAFFNPRCEILPSDNGAGQSPIIPEDVMAATSPDYYEYCARTIIETFEEHCHEDGWIAVNCSSQTIMRSIYEIVAEKAQQLENVKILGERISGGDGKIGQILEGKKDGRGIFFYQNFLYPVLQELDFKAVILQKFPFPFPHPITEFLETRMAEKDLKFWDLWTIPLVSTKLSRNLSGFKGKPPLIVIDPRENSKWAKTVWERFG